MDGLPARVRAQEPERGDRPGCRSARTCIVFPRDRYRPTRPSCLGRPGWGKVINELKQLCDYLLIDTPPVLPVSDALLLAPHADAVILTARLHSSTRGEMDEVRSLLDRAGVRVIGVVAGGVKTKHGYYYKRGYGYGYGYGYQ